MTQNFKFSYNFSLCQQGLLMFLIYFRSLCHNYGIFILYPFFFIWNWFLFHISIYMYIRQKIRHPLHDANTPYSLNLVLTCFVFTLSICDSKPIFVIFNLLYINRSLYRAMLCCTLYACGDVCDHYLFNLNTRISIVLYSQTAVSKCIRFLI